MADVLIGQLVNKKNFNNWAIGTFQLFSGDTVKITGELVCAMETRRAYELYAEGKTHPQYGFSYAINNALPYIDASPAVLIKLIKKNYKGAGEQTAKKIVEDWQKRGQLKDLRDLLLSDPASLDFTPYTKGRKIVCQIQDGQESFIQRSLEIRFSSISSMNVRVFKQLAKYLMDILSNKYGEEEIEAAGASIISEAISIYTENPYLPIRFISYYGFRTADEVGMMLGFERNDKRRLSALVIHVLGEWCERLGYSYLTGEQLQKSIASFDNAVNIREAISAALDEGVQIIHTEEGETGRYYLKRYYETEQSLARLLADRMTQFSAPIWSGTEEELLESIIRSENKFAVQKNIEDFRLDDSQRQALMKIFMSQTTLHTLTAGPGCGKTALMEILADIMHESKNIIFCAPTGKAAKVLLNRVSQFELPATTIHTLLGYREGGFEYNESNPLKCDILVSDESGMNDLCLTYSLLSAVRPFAHIIFLGDPKQLPSIGVGSVLSDFLNLPLDHNSLNKTHRNKGGILQVVNHVGSGMAGIKNYEDVSFNPLPEADPVEVDNIVACYSEGVEKAGGDLSKVALLVARRKGRADQVGWNATYLNQTLRKQFNAFGEKIKGTQFSVNDRILIKKNQSFTDTDNHNEKDEPTTVSVVNGDTGYIFDYAMDLKDEHVLAYLILKLDDGRVIRYPAASVTYLDWAYALSVHASQGSEYDYVVFLNVGGTPSFIHAGIGYTACSRAKKQLTVFTQPETWTRMVKSPIPKRNSSLVERTEAFLATNRNNAERNGLCSEDFCC